MITNAASYSEDELYAVGAVYRITDYVGRDSKPGIQLAMIVYTKGGGNQLTYLNNGRYFGERTAREALTDDGTHTYEYLGAMVDILTEDTYHD
jgi:hypothetical protein